MNPAPASDSGPATVRLAALERLVNRGHDSALLRFGLGKGYLDAADADRALEPLRACVQHDPRYSAAWKLLGKAATLAARPVEARAAWTRGLAIARENRDVQAAKEMTVFLRRLDKAVGGTG